MGPRGDIGTVSDVSPSYVREKSTRVGLGPISYVDSIGQRSCTPSAEVPNGPPAKREKVVEPRP